MDSLFIGGAADGKWLRISEDCSRDRVIVPVRSENVDVEHGFTEYEWCLTACRNSVVSTIRTEVFIPHKFRSGEETFVVFAEQSLTSAQILHKLIVGYKKP